MLEDNHKPTVDAQRRLNQAMKDVVRKEILKWLDVGYNQIAIALEDQSKTTFTCTYGTFAFHRMPFGLCNAPATFQHCMTAIFSDLNEDWLEIFMDDFSTFGDNFDNCLSNLEKVLKRYKEMNLVLNWEKCHFTVDEGIVLGHKISSKGMEGRQFEFNEECIKEFNLLKQKLVTAPIVELPDWKLPFELMCDASDYAVGAVLGQRKGKIFHPIYYASKTLNDAQCADQIIRRCIPEEEQQLILEQCHSAPYGGHFGGNRTTSKAEEKSSAEIFCLSRKEEPKKGLQIDQNILLNIPISVILDSLYFSHSNSGEKSVGRNIYLFDIERVKLKKKINAVHVRDQKHELTLPRNRKISLGNGYKEVKTFPLRDILYDQDIQLIGLRDKPITHQDALPRFEFPPRYLPGQDPLSLCETSPLSSCLVRSLKH
ncbi:hypothetical protein GQ457_03G019020 [Hibiscus cannabinus]